MSEKEVSFNVPRYDSDMTGTRPVRIAAVDRLALNPGDSVLDFGCGTGLSFEFLQEKVGADGRIIGVDLSTDMLGQAQKRVEEHSWENVTLIEGNASTVDIPEEVDGVLCFFTHDIMNSRPAVERALAPLKPGRRFVAAGIKKARGLRGIRKNIRTYRQSRRFITTKVLATLFLGTAVPWSNLEELMGPLELEETRDGTNYIAYAVKR